MLVNVGGHQETKQKKNPGEHDDTIYFKSLAASTISRRLATHGCATITTTHANTGINLNQVVTLDDMEQHD